MRLSDICASGLGKGSLGLDLVYELGKVYKRNNMGLPFAGLADSSTADPPGSLPTH